jgi:hypothetical protein
MKMREAEQMSERALTFLSTRPSDLQRFLTASGLDADELLDKSDDKAILSAVLGFVAADESLAKDFSQAEGLKPGVLVAACAALDPHGSTAW